MCQYYPIYMTYSINNVAQYIIMSCNMYLCKLYLYEVIGAFMNKCDYCLAVINR